MSTECPVTARSCFPRGPWLHPLPLWHQPGLLVQGCCPLLWVLPGPCDQWCSSQQGLSDVLRAPGAPGVCCRGQVGVKPPCAGVLGCCSPILLWLLEICLLCSPSQRGELLRASAVTQPGWHAVLARSRGCCYEFVL